MFAYVFQNMTDDSDQNTFVMIEKTYLDYIQIEHYVVHKFR